MPEPYSLFFLPQALALLDRAQCTRAEKSSLLPLIEALIRLGKKGQLEGLLALEDEIDIVANDLLRQALVHISMGVDPDDVTELLVTQLLSSQPRGRDLLEGLVVLRGSLGVYKGVRDIEGLLVPFLGTDADLWTAYQESLPSEDLAAIIATKKRLVFALPGRDPVQDMLAPWLVGSDKDSLRHMHENTGLSQLAQALWNTTPEALDAALSPCSDFVVDGILDKILRLTEGGAVDWKDAQRSIIAILEDWKGSR